MRIHILGICGTFMAGLAQILKESGHEVSGSDSQFYPPMSDYIQNLNIEIIQGFEEDSLPEADLYVIGNALSRGNDCIEKILDQKLPFVSGPEILGKELKDRNVFAVSGTHGKTTTSYMLCHILIDQGRDIGYLVGGISKNMENPAKLGTNKTFVIEADEYDSAFFDKRSKFIHYFPSNLIINNIEFDHADIFDNLNDIKKQFHHLIKIIPKSGNIIYFEDDINTSEVLKRGHWCNKLAINNDTISADFNSMEFKIDNKVYSLSDLPLIGEHNFKNYICAILAAKLDGIDINDSIKSLKNFEGVKRRMDFVKEISNIRIYDDFAHHPTAISLSSKAIRKKYPNKKIMGIVELGSNTMSSGYHKENLIDSFESFDEVFLLDQKNIYKHPNAYQSCEDLFRNLKEIIFEYDIILIMTNKNSQKFIEPIIKHLEKK
ncbi:MAG: UDP-N-acetylmuramate:L-alanyl-gamma-D-glutamyl-meso-diaminopimelate ligase [SAR86 cluster bacterium]|uniref:UDP-N-acetylmuramate:L-alanyl-gamma-D-glutamyl-meso-diaminopimelate ligase n=1 Tax=SAR86 cluster bacterium TaxID=2030880 RepID=A0A520MVW3_9GAMM|nr:MAG: UDP-N-acetylmuramate:L-alanyl-gamma-D-glutamyl-meso-diaminopimelate ligase [SAR86 cluster bacterium]